MNLDYQLDEILKEFINLDDVIKSSIPLDESEFTYKIAQAAADGKKKIKIGNKEYPVKMSKEKAKEILDEEDKMQESDKMPPGYKAKKGTKRGDKLRALTKRYKKALETPGKKDDLAAIKARDKYEKSIAEKPGYKSRKSKYTESVLDSLLDDLLTEIAMEEARKKKKKPKKISKKTDTALKNKAKKSKAPVGALKAVYRKGLGAFYTSGSRPGQSPHAWAMARVNSFLKGGKARQVDAAQWNQVKKFRKKKRKKK